MKNFLPEQGFEPGADGHYLRNLARHPPRPATDFPIEIDLVAEAAA